MAHLFIKHKVKDYPQWKKVFDGFVDTRRAKGEKSYEIFHPEAGGPRPLRRAGPPRLNRAETCASCF